MNPTIDKAPELIRAILADNGPLNMTTLRQELRNEGLRLSVDDLDDLLHDADVLPLVICLPDDRHGLADELFAGRTFTHRLTETDIACDTIPLGADLVALFPLIDSDAPEMDFADDPASRLTWGSECPETRIDAMLTAGIDPEDVIALPPDTLAGQRPGSLVAVTFEAWGTEVTTLAGRKTAAYTAAADRAQSALNPALARCRQSFGGRATSSPSSPPTPVPLGQLVAAACDADPEAFDRPTAPLSELLEEARLTLHDGEAAEVGFDFDAWALARAASAIIMTHEIPYEAAITIAQIERIVTSLAEEIIASPDEAIALADSASDPTDLGDQDHEIFTAFLDPDIAEAFASDFFGGHLFLSRGVEVATAFALALDVVARRWIVQLPHASRLPWHWIRARCLEWLRDVPAAEQQLGAADAIDPTWPPLQRQCARYASDRGDAAGALALLRSASADASDPEFAFLSRLSSPARKDLGRNHPCWCGSGRKYKVCHLGKEEIPLASRAGWLYRKLTRFVEEGPRRGEVIDLAQRRAAFDNSGRGVLDALEDPFTFDTLFFEGGAAAEFATDRGHLLPSDELALLQRWIACHRSLFDVTEVRPGFGLTVRDIRTGEHYVVDEKAGSRQAKVGWRLLMRVVPFDDDTSASAHRQIFGGIEPVALHMEEAALQLADEIAEGSASPTRVVDFATSHFAPPRLTTPDEQPLVMCTARYSIPAVEVPRMTSYLDRHFETDEPGRWALLSGSPDDVSRSVHGALEFDGSELTATAMNEQRFVEVQDLLSPLGELKRVDVQRLSAVEMMHAEGREGRGPNPAASSLEAGRVDGGTVLTPDDLVDNPEMAGILDGIMREYERKWLDESIPALGGSTPRQAADDPTRRDDLIRLLATFDDGPPGAGAMSADRIRADLGLPQPSGD